MLDPALLLLGIDDLAKFRIVQFACRRPDFRGTAREYADELGFRSIRRTAEILHELADRRLLDRLPGANGDPDYRITSRADRRQELATIGFDGPPTADDAGLIRRLAAQSLRRARRPRATAAAPSN